MTGTFILSLDCEGKWGMADVLKPYHHQLLTNDALACVYDDLIKLFAEYDVPATFAYVLAFTLSASERRNFAHLLERNGRNDPWLSHFWAAEQRGEVEGWFQPKALDVVQEDGRHEIACHSFCHRPLGDGDISAEEAGAELDAAEMVGRSKGLSLKTFIFPRNNVGHLTTLRQKGYLGYREVLRRSGGRAASLAAEFNIRPAPQPALGPSSQEELIAIPAGYFFNWRFGVRRFVPPAVTVRRWKSLLKEAASSGDVAHLWLHPHNLITGPGTREPLRQVLAYAARLRCKGQLEIKTQERYCRDLLEQNVQ
jgi:peptidoglycan/xylan/chitin deacetylase (PgdA/CDA1 family)